MRPMGTVSSSDRAMFSATVSASNSEKCWNTMPMPSLRAWAGLAISTGSPFQTISPEAGSSILFRDREQAPHMASSMKIVADDLKRLGVVDRVIAEPPGGAHSDPEAAISAAGDAIEEELRLLSGLSPEALRTQRAERFVAIGRVQS